MLHERRKALPMAERRMFAKTIIDSDAFLDMPLSSQSLYFHLSMRADDDGFINNPKKIQRMIGATEDDLKLLIAKKFIITFDTGVVVIKHWKIHNYLRSDRYKETVYLDEKAMLKTKENKAYTLAGIPGGIPTVYQMDTQVSIGKDSKGKDIKRGAFSPPSVDEVRAYCTERSNNVDPETFVDFYESKGWMVGKNKMKDWKAAVRNWERSRKMSRPNSKFNNAPERSGDMAKTERLLLATN